jgi:ribosomal protein S18 acetylase RimI-like enzyme
MNQESVVIRPATRGDVTALGRLGATLMHTHYAFDPARFLSPGANPERGYASFLLGQIDEPDVAILVAVRGADVVGYVYAGLEPLSWKELRGAAGFIHDVVVDDAARRGGVARALVQEAAERLRALGAPRVMLWTAEKNAAAQRLFESLGFRRTMIEMTLELQSGGAGSALK